MFVYGQTAANAIAIISYLASAPDRLVGSREIARERKISSVLTAKLLTKLAAAGLVGGHPGPGGGYCLSRHADEISLLEIVSVFEKTEPRTVCPFGEGWCGNGDPCPLHDQIQAILREHEAFLKQTSLLVFLPDQGKELKPYQHLTALQKRFSKHEER